MSACRGFVPSKSILYLFTEYIRIDKLAVGQGTLDHLHSITGDHKSSEGYKSQIGMVCDVGSSQDGV